MLYIRQAKRRRRGHWGRSVFLPGSFQSFGSGSLGLSLLSGSIDLSELLHRRQAFTNTVQGVEKSNDFGALEKIRVNFRAVKGIS